MKRHLRFGVPASGEVLNFGDLEADYVFTVFLSGEIVYSVNRAPVSINLQDERAG